MRNGRLRQGFSLKSALQHLKEFLLRKTLIVKTALAAAAAVAVTAPLAAEAQPPHHHQVLVCPTASGVRRNANNGTLIGAAGGALVGQAIGHNTGGTLIGAGVGAVAGHEIARNRAKRNCHYEYR
jgi:hypothetical protein